MNLAERNEIEYKEIYGDFKKQLHTRIGEPFTCIRFKKRFGIKYRKPEQTFIYRCDYCKRAIFHDKEIWTLKYNKLLCSSCQ